MHNQCALDTLHLLMAYNQNYFACYLQIKHSYLGERVKFILHTDDFPRPAYLKMLLKSANKL